MGTEFHDEGFRGTGSDDLHLGERDWGASSPTLSPAAEGGVGEVMLLRKRGSREPATFKLSQKLLAPGDAGARTAGRWGKEVWFHDPAFYHVPAAPVGGRSYTAYTISIS